VAHKPTAWSPAACETPRKLGKVSIFLAAVAVLAFLGTAAPVRAWQPEPGRDAAAARQDDARSEEGAPHEESIVSVIARLVNFGVLAGALVYFLRAPMATYLTDRGAQIRADLVNANETKREAAAHIEEIDRKMKALPAELEALRTQGAKEIATEEERIRVAAATERDRLLEQARREIELQVRVAERELVNHAADLAVGVATERIKKNITTDDQKTLVDHYVQQLPRQSQ
jgi:F-type H+-transporting ATPase subunit b